MLRPDSGSPRGKGYRRVNLKPLSERDPFDSTTPDGETLAQMNGDLGIRLLPKYTKNSRFRLLPEIVSAAGIVAASATYSLLEDATSNTT